MATAYTLSQTHPQYIPDLYLQLAPTAIRLRLDLEVIVRGPVYPRFIAHRFIVEMKMNAEKRLPVNGLRITLALSLHRNYLNLLS